MSRRTSLICRSSTTVLTVSTRPLKRKRSWLTSRQCSDLTRELAAAGKDGVFENRDRLTKHPVDLDIHIKYGRMGETHVAQPVGQG